MILGCVSCLYVLRLIPRPLQIFFSPWDFFGRNDAKAETSVLWPPHAKSWLIGKDSDAGRDWGQEEKGTTEDEMAGWHHWLDGCESEWTLGVGDGQGGLACCDSWGCKESDTTEQLNWTELNVVALVGKIYLPMQETWKTCVWSLGQKDPLEEGMTTHSSILAWRILWRKEPGGLQSIGSQRVRYDWSDWADTHRIYMHLSISYTP